MKKVILPVIAAIMASFLFLCVVDPISHPSYMVGTWDTEHQADYILKSSGICTNKGIPGRWYVKNGYVYLSSLFAYEEAEVVSETQWIMNEDGYKRRWTKVE